MPTVRFGEYDVSRLTIGGNPFRGNSHLSDELNADMWDYHGSGDTVIESWFEAEKHDITDHKGTQRRPVVIEDKCMGCGLCEEACPVQDARAIIVEHYAQERRSTGSYVTKKKKRLREVGDDHGTDYLREYRTTAPSAGGGTGEDDDGGAY
jgi:NAD-dependent dihydropyrimidine dehydrogenase PreA subunit